MIPDYESLMLPLLQLLQDGGTRTIADCRQELAERFGLTESQLAQTIPSGRTPLFSSRVHWAKTYLGKAGALGVPRRGLVQITDRGRELLSLGEARITTALLSDRYAEVRQWRGVRREPRKEGGAASPGGPVADLTPDEALAASYHELRKQTESELVERAAAMPAARFEQLVVDLLGAMGYGGAEEQGIRLGKSGDGGIDGMIKQDKLGFDRIYVQAKRWQGTVGPSVIREFASALRLKGATRGAIITPSTFTRGAESEADRLGVVLVDGPLLGRLMFDAGLGVSVAETFTIKRVDSGYFEAEE